MSIPEWITKWIQQEDDEFTGVVCNEGRSYYTQSDVDTANAFYVNQIWTEETDITRPTLDASED